MIRIPLIKRIDVYIHIFTLLLIMNVGLPLYRRMTGFRLDVIEGDPLRRNLMLLGFILSLLPFIIKPSRMISFLINHAYIIIILLLVAASLIWTGYPQVAFRRVTALYLTIFYAIALYMKFPGRSLLNLLGLVFFITILTSIILAILVPSWGVMTGGHAGAWRGVLLHKNSLGKYGLIGLILFIYLWKTTTQRTSRWFWGLGIVAGMAVVYKSDSVSAYVLFLVILIAAVLIRVAREWKKDWQIVLILIIFIAGIGLMVFIDQIELIFTLLGRDTTLTGRFPLWSALIDMVFTQPLGFGYGTFWMGNNYPSSLIWESVRWKPTHGHNGFIDLTLQLGWHGLMILLVFLGYYTAKHFFKAVAGRQLSALWFVFLTFIILYNVSESSLLAYNSIYTVLLLLAFFSGSTIYKSKIENCSDVNQILPSNNPVP